ncbi:MAG: hypothetical protein K6U79_11165 [Firmicutes bacterium]|nr:hypothetical protein [Bacillota bacterium]
MSGSGEGLAGWAEAVIRLEPPLPMGGYAARREPARSVHDPLQVRALALGAPGSALVLAVADLLAVERSLVTRIRRRLAGRRPRTTLWLAATHTHSGPEVGRLLGAEPAPGVEEAVAEATLVAAERALSAMRPVRASWASLPVEGVATPRDHPETGGPLELDLLVLEDAEGDRAVFGSFPCHPTVLGESNLALSADLPGAFRRRLAERLGGDAWVTLATGAAGDVSTRHTRRAQDFGEVERLGDLLAARAEEALGGRRPLAAGPLRLVRRRLRLPAKEPPDPAALAELEAGLRERLAAAREAGREGEARTLVTALQGVEAARRMGVAGAPTRLEAELDAAAWGSLRLATVPGELYHRPGDAVRRAAGLPTLLLGYANGYLGYLPERQAYGQPDYEVLISPAGAGAAERVVAALSGMLADFGEAGARRGGPREGGEAGEADGRGGG